MKRIEVIAQQLVTDIGAHDCSYSRDLIAISDPNLPTVIGEQVLLDLRRWISPPDSSTNHKTACDAQHERTSAWLFKDNIFTEWELKGSLLWIHGKRMSLRGGVSLYLTTSFVAGSGKSVLWFGSLASPSAEAHIFNQLCNHPTYRSSVCYQTGLHSVFLFRFQRYREAASERPPPFATYSTLCLLERLFRHNAPHLFGPRKRHTATQR